MKTNLLKLTPAEFCAATNACFEGRNYALTQKTMADVWDHCPITDWLIWMAQKVDALPDDKTLRLFAVWCVRNTQINDGRKVVDLLTDPRSLNALVVAERFANGKATMADLAAARGNAWDAAWAAGAAAEVAMEAAARKYQSDHFRTLMPNPFRVTKTDQYL